MPTVSRETEQAAQRGLMRAIDRDRPAHAPSLRDGLMFHVKQNGTRAPMFHVKHKQWNKS
jgi:hypothetical protein